MEETVDSMNDGDVFVIEYTRLQDSDNDFGKRESNNDPRQTNNTVICPTVNLKVSLISSASAQIAPPIRNA